MAFDFVDRKLLCKILRKFGYPAKFVGVIKYFHDEINASVSAACQASDPFGILTGV